MSDVPDPRDSRAADTHPRLRLAALVAVIVGVVLLAAAAFLLSYSGIHQIALRAGIAARLARLYPMIFDAMLVIAGAAALALRGAGWWTRAYVWLSLLVLLGAVAAADAVHAMGVALPRQPSRAAVAVVPWALLLLGFGFWLAMLRQLRRLRMEDAATKDGQGHPTTSPAWTPRAKAAVTWAGRGSAPARGGAPRTGIDALLDPRTPEVAGPQTERFTAEQGDSGDMPLHSPYIVHEVYPGVLTEQAPDGTGFVSALTSPGALAEREPGGQEQGAGDGALQEPALSRFGGNGVSPSTPGPQGESGHGGHTQPPPAGPDAARGDAGEGEGDEPGGADDGGEPDRSGPQAEAADGATTAESDGSAPGAGGSEGVAAAFDRMRSSPTPPHPTPSQD